MFVRLILPISSELCVRHTTFGSYHEDRSRRRLLHEIFLELNNERLYNVNIASAPYLRGEPSARGGHKAWLSGCRRGRRCAVIFQKIRDGAKIPLPFLSLPNPRLATGISGALSQDRPRGRLASLANFVRWVNLTG